MAEVIEFPIRKLEEKIRNDRQSPAQTYSDVIDQDPYYLFICNVLTTASSCGFQLPLTLDSAARHVYEKTRHTSQLAKLLEKYKQES
jgi:hypothetical protein